MSDDIDYDKSVSSAHLGANGWEMNEYNHANPYTAYVVYARDFRTGHVQLFTVSRTDFNNLAPCPGMGTSELSGMVAHLLFKAHEGQLTAEEQGVMGPVLINYVRLTGAYELWRDQAGVDDALHAILNIYAGGKVRPFVAPLKKPLLSAEEVMTFTQQVHDQDRRKHPEWFSG